MKAKSMRCCKLILTGLLCVCVLAGAAWAGNDVKHSVPAKFERKAIQRSNAQAQPESKNPLVSADAPIPAEKNTGASEVAGQSQAPPAETSGAVETPETPEESKPEEAVDESAQAAPEEPETKKEEAAEEAPDKPLKVAQDQKTGALTFNFDNAELPEVIRAMSDLLEINYLIDPKVGGKVTIHTAGTLDKKELFPIFYQILEVNGLTAVKDGKFYRIIPAKDAMRMPITSRSGREGKKAEPGEEIIIQIIPLSFISADEMSKILTSFVSADGAIVAHAESNMLLIVDRANNISKILKLVNTFDSNVFDRVNYRFFPILYGDVSSLADTMNQMVVAYGSAFKTNIAFIPIVAINTLLVVGSNPKAFDEITDFIKNYDVPSQSTVPTIFVYPVKNSQAAEIAKLLNDIFKGKKEKKEEKKSTGKTSTKYRNPLMQGVKQELRTESSAKTTPAQEQPAGATGLGTGTGTGTSDTAAAANSLRGDVSIIADETRNSLIIQASPADFQIIKNLLTQIDIMPRQVLIETTFAEILLTDETKMGVEWQYTKGEGHLNTSLLSASAGKDGMSFTIGDPSQWTAILTAFASQNKVNILSAPSVLASNGLPASIDVSTEIPIATTTYQYTSTDNPVFSSDIEYRDTGVMLSVTPHINELGLVTLEIEQEVSEKAGDIQVGDTGSYPSFFKRSTKTTLTVQSGQTIVIGGLIRETKANGAAGTPWLVSIPILNFLFGSTGDRTERTELIIMISPYVIAQLDEAEAVSKEFKNKLNALFPEEKGTPEEVLQNTGNRN
jgi:general secretion pathway protein D